MAETFELDKKQNSSAAGRAGLGGALSGAATPASLPPPH